MGEIRVDVNYLTLIEKQLIRISSELQAMESVVSNTVNKLNWDIPQKNQIDERLNHVRSKVVSMIERTRQMEIFVNKVVREFVAVDKGNSKELQGLSSSFENLTNSIIRSISRIYSGISDTGRSYINSLMNIFGVIGNSVRVNNIFGLPDIYSAIGSPKVGESALLPLLFSGAIGQLLSNASTTNKDSLKSSYKFSDFTKKIEDELEDKGLSKKYKDGKIDNAKKVASLLEVSKSGTVSASLINEKYSGDIGWANGEVTAKVGNAEATASASAGLYVVDKNGNKLLSPGVGAKVGVGVQAVQVKASGQVGSDMIGVYGKGEVSALTAAANAEVGLGMVNGEFEAKVSAGAEAKLAEAKGQAGLNVLGGEVGVSGSVNIGVGAKADIGYADGKVKCELGAALGVGVNVGFEADIGGMVSTVGGAASSAVSSVSGVAESAWDKLSFWD